MKTQLLATGFALGLAACAPGAAPEPSASGLDTISVPDGFTFATRTDLSLTVRSASEARVRIHTETGGLVFDGPVAAGAAALELSLPRRDTKLVVVHVTGETEVRHDVIWDGGPTASVQL